MESGPLGKPRPSGCPRPLGVFHLSPASSRIPLSIVRPLSVSAYAPLSRSCVMKPLTAMDCIACVVIPTREGLIPVAVQNKSPAPAQ